MFSDKGRDLSFRVVSGGALMEVQYEFVATNLEKNTICIECSVLGNHCPAVILGHHEKNQQKVINISSLKSFGKNGNISKKSVLDLQYASLLQVVKAIMDKTRIRSLFAKQDNIVLPAR